MDLHEDPDPQTITADLELPGVKSTDAENRLHDDKLTISGNRSAPPLPGSSVRGVSLSPVLGPEVIALPWPIHRNSSSTDLVNDFAEPTGNGQTPIVDGVPSQQEQPQSEIGEWSSGLYAFLPLANVDVISVISTGISHDGEAPAETPLVGDVVASSFPLGSDAVATATSRPVGSDVSLQIDDDEPLADVAPPRQEQPQSHSTKFDTSRSTEVDHILSLFGGKNGFKQLLQLESDEAQHYADILDTVRYPIKLHSAPADLTLRPVSKRENTAQSNTDKAAEVFAEALRNLWHPSIIVHSYGHIRST